VIGLDRFSYDLWGDTVNTASRMESHAAPGTIQTTVATYERLRGPVHVGGPATMDATGRAGCRSSA
jgi:adenylate cyclase